MTRTNPTETNDVQSMLLHILTVLQSNKIESQRAQDAQARQANIDARTYPLVAERQRLLSEIALMEHQLAHPNPTYPSFLYETLHICREFLLPQLQACDHNLAQLRTAQEILDHDNQVPQNRLL